MFSAREIEIFAQDFEQGFMRRESDFGLLAIERELDVRFLFGYFTTSKLSKDLPRRWPTCKEIPGAMDYR